MPRVRTAARPLKKKALDSFRLAATAYNSAQDEGRHTTVLLFLQHSFEMLLKSALIQREVDVFRSDGKSISFKTCLNHCSEQLGLTADEIGTLSVIDKFRDDEQHFYTIVDEAVLHLQIRAAVPIFDKILQSTFGETIADSLPERVLPLSTVPVQSMQLLLDSQFRRIRELLSPGTRKQNEARAMIRGLLAISPLAGGTDLEITEKDVDKALRAINAGRNRLEVFPELKELTVEVSPNTSSTLVVRFTKKKDAHAVPFTYVPEGTGAVAVEEVDKSRLYCFTRAELYERLGVSNERGAALRWHCGMEGDEQYHRNHRHGKMELPKYTIKALNRLRQTMRESDSDKILADYRRYRESQKGAS